MDYAFQVVIEVGEFEGLEGTISGTLDESRPYLDQLQDIEKQFLGFCSCYGIARTMLAPTRQKVFEFVEYWQQCKENEADLELARIGDDEHGETEIESLQTELF